MWRWWPILAAGCASSLAAPAIPELPHGQCENGATGADGYFVGRFTLADGKVTGTETWVLYANQAWKAKGGRDCSLTWNVVGSTTGAGKCVGCSTSFRFHAEPDIAGSNCPDELLHGRRAPTGQMVGSEAGPFDQHYDVATSADGSAVVSFASSGRELGKGRFSGGTLEYTSHHQCKFF